MKCLPRLVVDRLHEAAIFAGCDTVIVLPDFLGKAEVA